MNDNLKNFLAHYDRKMPGKGVPKSLLQRLEFSQPNNADFSLKHPILRTMFTTFLIATTTLVSAFTFWKLGEDSLFVLTIPTSEEPEAIPQEMINYLDLNSDQYLSWSIFSRTYFESLDLKLFVGEKDSDLYLFYYIDTPTSFFVRINSSQGDFMFSGYMDELTINKSLIRYTDNITVTIYVSDSTTSIQNDYYFRIPKYRIALGI